MNSLFSVIIPTYNRPEYLKTAMESILAQTVEDWELIIVDDGSDAETRKVVHSFNDPRITYIYQDNKKQGEARNNGMQQAKGTYICFLDDDDFYRENHLKHLKQAIEASEYPVAFFYTGINRQDEKGNIKKIKLPDEQINEMDQVLMHTIFPSSVCIHQRILEKFTFQPEHVPAEDRALWVKIVAAYPLIQLPVHSIVMHQHEDQMTKSWTKKFPLKSAKMEIKIFEELFKKQQLQQVISNNLKKRFFCQRYYYDMYTSISREQYFLSLYFFVKYLSAMPSVLFKKKSLKALKDIILL